MPSQALATGYGAAEGLEKLLIRQRADEEMARRIQQDQVLAGHYKHIDDMSGRSQDRLDRSADIANDAAQVRADMMKQIGALLKADSASSSSSSGGTSSTPNLVRPDAANASVVPNSGAPVAGPREVSGFMRLNTPEGRTMMQMAQLNPNETFGSVPQPHTEASSTDDEYYDSYAKKLGKAGRLDLTTEERNTADHERAVARHIPNSMASQSEPMLQVDDPDNPGMTMYVPRSQAAGRRAPRSSANKEKIIAYNATLDLIDQIETLGEKTGWKGLGPIEGRLGRAKMSYLGEGNADEEALRNKIDQLRAAASFEQGGKTFTGSEKQMLDEFLGQVNQNPAATKVRLKEFRASAFRSLENMGSKRNGPNGEEGGGADPGADAYAAYLRRINAGPPK